MKHCINISNHRGEHDWCECSSPAGPHLCGALAEDEQEPTIEIPVALLVNLRNSDRVEERAVLINTSDWEALQTWMMEHGL